VQHHSAWWSLGATKRRSNRATSQFHAGWIEGWESIAPSPLGYVRSPTHANAGATEPRRLPDELENVRRSRYFFLAAFFLAAGFLAAFFLAAILVYLLHSISDPMNGFGGGSQMHSSKRSAAHQLVASVMATMSSTTFKVL